MKNKEYIEKWLAGTLSESEKQEFEKTRDFSELKKLDEHLQYFKAPEFRTKQEYNRLKKQLADKGKVVEVNWWKPLLKVAAVLLLLVVSFSLFIVLPKTELQTLTAEKSEYFLPDSSKVVLNAESQITFRSFLWNRDRELHLKGEAFFDVAEGSKFEVNTNHGIVTVLGTEFNVLARENFFEVVCFEGKVSVTYEDKENILTAGKGLHILNGKVITGSTALSDKPGWMKNESTFKSVPYIYVLEEFERQYGRSIKAESVNKNTLFTGTFVHDDLNLALKSITQPLNLQYTIKEEGIILSRGE